MSAVCSCRAVSFIATGNKGRHTFYSCKTPAGAVARQSADAPFPPAGAVLHEEGAEAGKLAPAGCGLLRAVQHPAPRPLEISSARPLPCNAAGAGSPGPASRERAWRNRDRDENRPGHPKPGHMRKEEGGSLSVNRRPGPWPAPGPPGACQLPGPVPRPPGSHSLSGPGPFRAPSESRVGWHRGPGSGSVPNTRSSGAIRPFGPH
jgi:hypothetical protein